MVYLTIDNVYGVLSYDRWKCGMEIAEELAEIVGMLDKKISDNRFIRFYQDIESNINCRIYSVFTVWHLYNLQKQGLVEEREVNAPVIPLEYKKTTEKGLEDKKRRKRLENRLIPEFS